MPRSVRRVVTGHDADGKAVVLDRSNDIEFGTWDDQSRTFSVLSGSAASSANAVRITGRRTAARGSAVSLVFAAVVGQRTCDVRANQHHGQ